VVVFVSKNIIRKCKYCDNPPKENINNGRRKGYYRTCGLKKCTQMQYKDENVCAKKGRMVLNEKLICIICNIKFKRISSNHKIYCKKCVPDKSWRARAQRYGIGKPQWDALIIKQNNKCVLCEKIPEVIDHCHKTHIVRGLLCSGCNIQIAKMDNCREWLIKAIKYIGE
jgi:Recombination endonuclease VII